MANTSFDIAGSGGVKATVKMGALALDELLADSGAARLAWEAYTMRNEPDLPMATPSTATHVSWSFRRRRRSLQDLPRRTKRVAPGPQSLPSIESEEETLYFLHWSQRYCSASGVMGLLELMESELPPARMRVNLVLQNEPLFSQAFNCAPKREQTPFVLG
ncbi:uncharacterized protein LOC126998255 [Eriocheir sinensis]|uniref:uncharacterized protein LOC126998255 n=1 Tax=Eriocheir sinensis TaxID=95602 RepID=UPI0021C950E9|nr:uncharacterized protein LOC126998255 [Eriocheir sinensis]